MGTVWTSLWGQRALRVFGAALLLSAGCNALWSVDDLSADSTASSASGGHAGAGGGGDGADGADGGTGGAEPICPAGYECRPDAKYVARTTPADGCGPQQQELTVVECSADDCQCDAVGPPPPCGITIRLYEDAACGGQAQAEQHKTGGSGTCMTATVHAAGGVRAQAELEVPNASCAASGHGPDPVPVQLCSEPPAGTCDGGVCVRSSLSCLLTDAIAPCPLPYLQQQAVWSDDTVTCGCDCEASASCPNTNLWVYTLASCDTGVPVPMDGNCHNTTLQSVVSSWLAPGGSAVQCAATIDNPDPRKLCCAK